MRQWMRDAFHQESCAGVPLLDIRCRTLSLTDSGCRSHSTRQRLHETLYQTTGAKYSLYKTANARPSLA